MRWLVTIVAAVVAFAAPAFAQTSAQLDEYGKLQKKGIDASTAKKYDEAIADFTKCLEIIPKDATSAYNIGCTHSIKGELDAAFEWLGKAVDWGFAALAKDEATLFETKDTDLANARKDPRFAPLMEKLKNRRKVVADFAAKPEIYVPEKLKAAETVPLLVVLHDVGQTRTTALEKGPWKKIADELGFALVLPSALCMTGSDPAAGMSWFPAWFDYAEKPYVYEKSVADAVDLFKKSHKIDPAKMFIVGEGQGGMVAFDVAICAPGSWKGVVVLASTVLTNQPTAARARTAGRASLPVRLLVPDSQVYSPGADPKQLDAEFTTIAKLFKDCDLPAHIDRFQRKSDEPDQVAELVTAAIKYFLPDEPGEGKNEGKDEKGEKDDKDGKGGG